MILFIKYFIVFLFIISKSSYAEITKKITIDGNNNVDDEIIFSIINEKISDYSTNNLNEIIKTLYETGNFKSVEIENKDNEIILKIIENPSIDKIIFNGNERFKKEEILEIFDKEKYFQTFNLSNINEFIFNLKNLYSSFGYNIVEIDYDIEDNDPSLNIINLIFNINEGNLSKINKIYFTGNDSFSSTKLKSIIKTKQFNILKLARSSNYKKYQIQEDKIKLLEFYKNSGFKNISIEIENEFIEKRNRLNVYFFINEGDQYYFRNIDFDFTKINIDKTIADKIIENELLILNKIINKNNFYKPEVYDESIDRLTGVLYKNAQFFFKIDVLEKEEDKFIDIKFEISETQPTYVNNINIYGNTRTKEKVIRREMTFVEGDPYNEIEIANSKKNLQRLGFFKNIQIVDEKIDNQVDLNIMVEEKLTGEFNIGVGIDSYDGATFITGLKEKNIYGDGRELTLNIDTSAHNTIYSFGIVEPYIFNKNIDLIFDASYSFKDRSEVKSYDLEVFNTDIGIRYDLTNKISHSIILEYILKDYEITNTSASDSVKKLGGNNADILLDNKINYFDLDSFFRPSRGSSASYLNVISPATNDANGYIKNYLKYSKYYTFKKKI